MACGFVGSRALRVFISVSLMFGLTESSRFRHTSSEVRALASDQHATASEAVSKSATELRSTSFSFLQKKKKKSARTCDLPSVRNRVVKHLWKVHGSKAGGHVSGEKIEALIKQLHVPASFDWRAFDHDMDGGFSEKEFFAAADKALQLPSSAKLVQKVEHVCARKVQVPKSGSAHKDTKQQSGEDALEKDPPLVAGPSATTGALNAQGHEFAFHQQMDRVFDKFARGSHGHLDAHQLADIMKQYAVPSSFDWHAFDVDKDGKLSKKEFLDAALKVAKMAK